MKGGVCTLSPIILIWPSPTLALGVGEGLGGASFPLVYSLQSENL